MRDSFPNEGCAGTTGVFVFDHAPATDPLDACRGGVRTMLSAPILDPAPRQLASDRL